MPSIVQCGSARHLPSSGAHRRQALLGVGGLRPLHTCPERRAGRHRPFWLCAAGCAAGFGEGPGVVLGVSSLRRLLARPTCGHDETPTGLGGPIRLPLSECGGDSYRITYMKARIGFAIATLAVGVTKVTDS